MSIIDITREIHPDMAIYPGNPEVQFEQVEVASQDSSALTKIIFGAHTGTHIDAPSHIKAGATGTGTYPLEQMIGPCEVAEWKSEIRNQKFDHDVTPGPFVDGTRSPDIIGVEDLPSTTGDRILIKTANSAGNPDVFNPDFVALDESAAQELVSRGVRLVGIDGPSIKKKGVKDNTHQILLDAGVVIIEGLWLADVEPGEYELLCLPLKIDSDGAPVRAVLRSL